MSKPQNTKHVLSFFWQRWRTYPKHVIGIAIIVPIAVLSENYLNNYILADTLNRLTAGDYVPRDI